MEQANRGGQDSELLQAQALVWNHNFNFINSMCIKCVVDLGIPDIIHNHGYPMTVTELVATLQISAGKVPFIRPLMRILVHSGFFTLQNLGKNNQEDGYSLTNGFFTLQNLGQNNQEDGYSLTNASSLLFKNEPMTITPILNAILEPILTKPWYCLASWLQNDDLNPFYTQHRTTISECAGRNQQFSNFFNDAMASDSQLVRKVLINKHSEVFEGLSSLVDVGGETGTLAKAIIAIAFPHLDYTVFDLPHVVTGLQGRNNLKHIGGDMFDAVPPAHVLLLKCILHDWSDKECVKILNRCKEAIKKNGTLIIIDMVRMNKGDKELIETQLLVDMLMMVVVTGKERNEEEWVKLFSEAGFSNYKVLPILGLRSLIEVYP